MRASELRTLNRDVEAAYAEAAWRRPSIARSVLYDALAVATEHCRYYARDGTEPEALPQAPSTTWREALWRIADLWIDECWPRLWSGQNERRRSAGDVQEPAPLDRDRDRRRAHSGGMNGAPLQASI